MSGSVHGPFSKREEHLVQFNYELALGGIGEVALEMFEEVIKEIDDLRWWQFFERHSLTQECRAIMRLYEAAVRHEHEQAEAAKRESTWA